MMTDKYTALTEEKDENTIIAERRAKLALLRAEGVAFPNDFRPQHQAATLAAQYADVDRETLESQPVHVAMAGSGNDCTPTTVNAATTPITPPASGSPR